MGHTVDHHIDEPIVARVVFLGIGIEIAIAGAQHPLPIQTITDTHIDTFGLGRFQILILSCLPRVVFHDIVSWRLGVGDGHEGDHVFHIINIPRHRHVQPSPVVLATEGIIVRRLRVELVVS